MIFPPDGADSERQAFLKPASTARGKTSDTPQEVTGEESQLSFPQAYYNISGTAINDTVSSYMRQL
jgi:peptidyl-tRNA hydrolase